MFLLDNKAISWASKKQTTIALSSAEAEAEAEYMDATSVACEATWLRKILQDVQQDSKTPIVIHCDNMSSIAMTKNPVFHIRTKHIEIRYHFIRELVECGEIKMEFCKTEEQLADIFTKPIATEKFIKFRDMLGVQEFSRLRGSVED